MQSPCFTLNHPMPPPWLVCPHIPYGHYNWDTGFAQPYLLAFSDWLDSLPADQQKVYQDCFPAPKQWSHFYQQFMQYADDIAEIDDRYYENDQHSVFFWEEEGKPKYDVQWLINHSQNNNNFVLFWGNKPPAGGGVNKSCLSQWWLSDFALDSVSYCCMEQYMMAEKACLFGDNESEERILCTQDQAKIKALGREVKNFDSAAWDQVKSSIVLNGNYLKFSQNEQLRHFLLHTEGCILVEASPEDWVWGIGFSEQDANATVPPKWLGENRLGFALMEVRDEITRVYRAYYQIDWDEIRRIYPFYASYIKDIEIF